MPDNDSVADFLHDWSERRYTEQFPGRTVTKRFGLSRATTLLNFLTSGSFPIFDSRVRRAIKRLSQTSIPNTVTGYFASYRPTFLEIAECCGTNHLRKVDRALFSYGGRTLRF